MAITRHAQHVQKLQASRQLRSGRNTVAHITIASHVHHVRKSRPSLLPILLQADRRAQISASRRSDVPGEVDQESGRPRGYNGSLLEEQVLRSVGSPSNSRLDGKALSRARAEPNPAAANILMSSSPDLDQSIAGGHTDGRSVISQGGEDQGFNIGEQENSPINPDDIGIPPGGLWEQDAAYEQRFCYDHGEFEYLLSTPDRWMSPSDFDIPSVETSLRELLQQHKDSPSKVEPHARCQAECWGNLYSHVYGVVDSCEYDKKTLFLVQWKACWTPESNLDNMSWVTTSLKAHANPNRRRSTRLENSFDERRKKYEKMMVVVNLDQ